MSLSADRRMSAHINRISRYSCRLLWQSMVIDEMPMHHHYVFDWIGNGRWHGVGIQCTHQQTAHTCRINWQSWRSHRLEEWKFSPSPSLSLSHSLAVSFCPFIVNKNQSIHFPYSDYILLYRTIIVSHRHHSIKLNLFIQVGRWPIRCVCCPNLIRSIHTTVARSSLNKTMDRLVSISTEGICGWKVRMCGVTVLLVKDWPNRGGARASMRLYS